MAVTCLLLTPTWLLLWQYKILAAVAYALFGLGLALCVVSCALCNPLLFVPSLGFLELTLMAGALLGPETLIPGTLLST